MLVGCGSQFVPVDPVCLHREDGEHVAPLPVRDLTAGSEPSKLPQHLIDRRTDPDPVAGIDLDRLSARQLPLIQRVIGEDEDVDLDRRFVVEQVERRAVFDGLEHHLLAHVVVITDGGHQRSDVAALKGDGEVDVERRTRLSDDRTRERSAEHPFDAEVVEDGSDSNDEVERGHQPSTSGSHP
ncbi:MAG: hypothetical protein ACK5CE_16835 [Actinomycetes bacterium]